MSTGSIAEVTTNVYNLLEPLDPESRGRVIRACLALLGDTVPTKEPVANELTHASDASLPSTIGLKALRWLRQNAISSEELEQVFHFDDSGKVEIIASEILGASKKEQAANVYLLCGVASFLQSDEPTVDNATAVQLAKHLGCWDKNNHHTNRSSLGNRLTGSVDAGFTLPAPGLKAAAALVKAMASNGNDK